MRIKESVRPLVERGLRLADRIKSSKLLAAVVLLFQGVNFVIHADRAMSDMAKSVATTAVIAAILSLAGQLSRAKKEGLHAATLFTTSAILALGIWCVLRPERLSPVLQYLIAFTAIYLGVSNIARSARLEKISRLAETIRDHADRTAETLQKTILDDTTNGELSDLEKSVKESVEQQMKLSLKPVSHFRPYYSKTTIGSILFYCLVACMGVFLMIVPFETNAAMMILSGLTMILGASAQLLALLRASKIGTFLKENK